MVFRKGSFLVLILLVILILANNSGNTENLSNGGESCNNPSTVLTITAAPSGKDSDISYNLLSYNLDSGICITLTFQNKAPNIEHSFVIDSTTGFQGFSLDLKNARDGPESDGMRHIEIMTPSSNIDLTFYCGMVGHRQVGMEGTLYIRKVARTLSNNNLPMFPFVAITVIIVLLTSYVLESRFTDSKEHRY